MFKFATSTFLGKIIATFLLSMVPVIELRGGIPYGIALGLDYPIALVAAILGNMIPVPFIIIYIRRIFHWLRRCNEWWNKIIFKLEKRAHLKGRIVNKYSAIGLCILVAIPLPGTGAWTGALVAAMLDMRLKTAISAIFLGVCISAAIMTTVTVYLAYTLT